MRTAAAEDPVIWVDPTLDSPQRPPETPGRSLRLAVLRQALSDLKEGGKNGREALEWLLQNDRNEGGEGLSARALLEELGLNPDVVQSALRRKVRQIRSRGVMRGDLARTTRAGRDTELDGIEEWLSRWAWSHLPALRPAGTVERLASRPAEEWAA